ncbi:hypothetical protein GJ744_000834 [Endocarpon pusillum]|uniref:chitinase n=1 Tax=Endocarpon pusillum TaxID=364733 RepID=A0A8H7ANW3_9EURO|nr:hypothetical protein GJ744_000834 [Endocarpon pusillum]
MNLFTFCTSHAYQHHHLRRTLLHKNQAHSVGGDKSQHYTTQQQRIINLQAEIDKKLTVRDSAIRLLNGQSSAKKKRWGHRHHHRDHHTGNSTSDSVGFTLEQLQQTLEDLNATIQSLYELLSSSLGGQSRTTTLPATAISTSTQYYTTPTPAGPSTTIYPIPASSDATATSSSSSNDAAVSTSSTFVSTTSTATRYSFDPMSTSNVAVYYGQTDQTSRVPLSTVCDDPDVDIIILAFVNKLSTGPAGYPTLNMGPRCWAASSAQVNEGATGLIDCVSDGFARQVKTCQESGKKVLLSIGGAVDYSDTTIVSEEDAVRIADNIWNLFGGGGMDNETIMAIRPFGDVIVDGFDIDNEDGSTLYWPTLISTLRTYFQTSQPSYPKPYYLSAAPQCPRPDASIPLSSMRTAIDFIFVQFYNNPSCNLNSPGFLATLQAWSDDLCATNLSSSYSSGFIDVGNGVTSPRIYVGAPAFPAAGSGWVGGQQFSELMEGVKEVGLGNLGGVMFWDGAYGVLSARDDGVYGRSGVGESYMGLVKDALEQ